jgi:hypothetical protein
VRGEGYGAETGAPEEAGPSVARDAYSVTRWCIEDLCLAAADRIGCGHGVICPLGKESGPRIVSEHRANQPSFPPRPVDSKLLSQLTRMACLAVAPTCVAQNCPGCVGGRSEWSSTCSGMRFVTMATCNATGADKSFFGGPGTGSVSQRGMNRLVQGCSGIRSSPWPPAHPERISRVPDMWRTDQFHNGGRTYPKAGAIGGFGAN